MNPITKKKISVDIFTISLFIVTTAIMIYYLQRTGRIFTESDFSFHASKVQQIYENLKNNSLFTFIATNNLQHTGVGTFLFYPSIFLYPWAFLKFFFNPIDAYYIWYGIFIFISFIVSYYCMQKFSKNNFKSIIFSYIYVLAPYRLYLGKGVLGEFLASVFLPIVFLGFYEIIAGNPKKWYLLSIGLALVSYCHILSVFLIFEVFIAILLVKIVFYKMISLTRLLALFKSALLTIVLSLPIIIPFITDFIHQNISSTSKGIGILADPLAVFEYSLKNETSIFSIGIILLVFLIFGWKLAKNSEDKKFYWTGVVLLIVATSLFPWGIFHNTILVTVQITNRYLVYSIFFLSIVSSSILSEVCKHHFYKKFGNKSFPLFSILVMVIGILSYCGSMQTSYNNISKYNPNIYLRKKSPKNNQLNQQSQYKQLDKHNYNEQFKYEVPYGETDYYPNASVKNKNSITNNISYVNGHKKKLQQEIKPNKIIYKSNFNKNTTINFPFLAYKNTTVKVNDKNKPFNISERGTVLLSVPAGIHKITIGYKPPIIYFIGIFIAVLGWIFITLYLVSKLLRKKAYSK
ncbi:putative membrane spanning protein [Fructilactobacillus florum]|uniref:putative membrane spanning protein n=1 Tax=Fructilactobacillus florum TaxID=640331 RepID=UPI00028D429A|nr:putative membrane spanning protein [Fructilactobacillus florum]EKK21029.1 putative membrane spanning protein [Fructilactobacillus florum 2F]